MGAAHTGMKMLIQKLRGLASRPQMWAVGKFVPLTGEQGGNSVTLAPFLAQALQGGSLADLFNAAFRIAIAIGAILAVVRLVYAGFIYMSTDVFGAKKDAKGIIWDAVGGLFLLLAIWIILYQINPQILQLDLLQSANGAPSDCAGKTAC